MSENPMSSARMMTMFGRAAARADCGEATTATNIRAEMSAGSARRDVLIMWAPLYRVEEEAPLKAAARPEPMTGVERATGGFSYASGEGCPQSPWSADARPGH